MPQSSPLLPGSPGASAPLGTFVASQVDGIIAEWKSVAKAFAPRRAKMREALPDHWDEILKAIATEIDGTSSALQAEADAGPSALQAAAEKHGALRQREKFELDELVGEFCAMRATVLRAWRRLQPPASDTLPAEQSSRFSEALDRALVESIERYSTDRAKERDLFLAVLGHDLRGPLSGIKMATVLFDRPDLHDKVRLPAAARIHRAVQVMERLITDLLDFTRSQLGSGLRFEKTTCDLALLAEHALDAARSSVPEHTFRAELSADLKIQADASRIEQLLSNLLHNAAQHGAPDTCITLRVHGDSDGVVLQVHNEGPPIPRQSLPFIFEPLVQASRGLHRPGRSNTSMGLGLFIVKEIVRGHGGTIAVESSTEAGTMFTVRLPYDGVAAAASPARIPPARSARAARAR